MSFNKVNEKMRKIFIFIGLSLLVLVIESFVVGAIVYYFPALGNISIFGIPFAMDFFVFGFTLSLLYIIFQFVYPKLNKRCL